MEKKKDQDRPSSSSPSPSPLPSHDAVCKSLFSLYRGTTMYQLYSKFYSTMVRQCPQSGMEEIQKAVKDGNKKEAVNIMNRLFDAHTASGDLHRINAEIYAQHLAESDNPSDREENLKKGIDSAMTSCLLSCSDIENHFVLISLVSQHARDEQGRQQVIRLCHEALAIDKYNDKDDPASPTSARSKITNFLQRERQQRIETFWKPMLNKHYTLVSIADLHTFVKTESDMEVIQEAWDFGVSHRSWKFWMCCCCEDKFDSSGLLFKHFADTHLTPQAKSIICAGKLLHGNPSSSCGRIPIQEWISVHAASSQLIVAASCLLNHDTETSQTVFPSHDLSIKADSYRGKLIQSVYFRDSARSQGAGIPLALEKMSRMNQAKSAGVITGISDLRITDDPQGTGEIEKALERLSADIDSEIKKNGEWILRTEEGIDDLSITDNPFCEFDYRDVLLPVVKSYLRACVEEQADTPGYGRNVVVEKKAETDVPNTITQDIEGRERPTAVSDSGGNFRTGLRRRVVADLPIEVQLNIISRLSAKNVHRCRLLSKHLFPILGSVSFRRMWMQCHGEECLLAYNSNIRGYPIFKLSGDFFEESQRYKFPDQCCNNLGYDPHFLIFISSHNGVITVFNDNSKQLYLWNPEDNTVINTDCPRTLQPQAMVGSGFIEEGVGCNLVTYFFDPRNDRRIQCFVLTSDRNMWEEIVAINFDIKDLIQQTRSPDNAGRCFWLAEKTDLEKILIGFDFNSLCL